jgi:hypothetical protein
MTMTRRAAVTLPFCSSELVEPVARVHDTDLTDALVLCNLAGAPIRFPARGNEHLIVFTNEAAIQEADRSGLFGPVKTVVVGPCSASLLRAASAEGLGIFVNPLRVDGRMVVGILERAHLTPLSRGGCA